MKKRKKIIKINTWVEKSECFNIFDKIFFVLTGRYWKERR